MKSRLFGRKWVKYQVILIFFSSCKGQENFAKETETLMIQFQDNFCSTESPKGQSPCYLRQV